MAAIVEDLNSLVPWIDPKAWQPRIANTPVPGRAIVRRPKSGFKLDEKNAPGANGATLTSRGKELGEFEIEVTVWDQQGWDMLNALCTMVLATKKRDGKPTAFDVYHPALEVHGIRRMFVVEVEGPDQQGTTLVVTLKCKQYAPPPKANATVTPASAVGTLPGVFPGEPTLVLPPKPKPPSAKAPPNI